MRKNWNYETANVEEVAEELKKFLDFVPSDFDMKGEVEFFPPKVVPYCGEVCQKIERICPTIIKLHIATIEVTLWGGALCGWVDIYHQYPLRDEIVNINISSFLPKSPRNISGQIRNQCNNGNQLKKLLLSLIDERSAN